MVCESSSRVGKDRGLVRVVSGTFLCVLLVIKCLFLSPKLTLPALGVLKLKFCPPLLALSGIVNRGVQGPLQGQRRKKELPSSCLFPLSNAALLQRQHFLPVAAAQSIPQFFHHVQGPRRTSFFAPPKVRAVPPHGPPQGRGPWWDFVPLLPSLRQLLPAGH